jgi:Pvc16 N-terminal domain
VSDPLAIAAVTATLRDILIKGFAGDGDVSDLVFTTQPPDKARTGTTNQLNLFLYQTTPNAAWQNQPMPHLKQGETGLPPLALDLHYLLTAYGRGDDDVFGHHVLGRAMSIYHDQPLLGRKWIHNAFAGSDVDQQPDRIRITPTTLTVDELSKLWNTFQTQYRISATYQVSAVLIESAGASRTPLPVLERGPRAQPDLTPPFPALAAVEPPAARESAHLGDTIELRGRHLDFDTFVARFEHPAWDTPVELSPSGALASTATGEQLVPVDLPDDPAARKAWPAGFYAVTAIVTKGGRTSETNTLPLAVAPRVAITPNPAARDGQGRVGLTATVVPEVRPRQRVALLFGEREVAPDPIANQTDTLHFVVPHAAPGDVYVRLRVDGVDSVLVNRTQLPPVFDQTQRVTVT